MLCKYKSDGIDTNAVREVMEDLNSLNRRKEDAMTEDQTQEPETDTEDEMPIEQMFLRLNEMTAQRDKLNMAISAFKKSIQRRVGRL